MMIRVELGIMHHKRRPVMGFSASLLTQYASTPGAKVEARRGGGRKHMTLPQTCFCIGRDTCRYSAKSPFGEWHGNP